MASQGILVVRLGSMGDIVHTLPAVHALRASFPDARLDWVVESRWRALVEDNPDISSIVELDRASWGGIRACISELRGAGYGAAVDFQGLYKSAVLAFFSGAKQRIGYDKSIAREGGAARFYNHRVVPSAGSAAHIIDQHMALATAAGARETDRAFPLCVAPEAEEQVTRILAEKKLSGFYVISPGGGWAGKLWPAEQYGHLHRRLAQKHGLRAVVNYGPGERKLAEAIRLVAHDPEPVLLSLEIPQLLAVVKRARLVVAADSGPLHLGCAMGVPVVGLYGPTDPARNGPFGAGDLVVRNARAEETTYKRSAMPAPSMLSITVDQVMAAVEKRLGLPG